MDRFESMNVLLAVADAGNLSAAGRRLGMPLPTVSRKVSELEAHLKSRLIVRSTKGSALTEAGRAYVAACRRILDEIHEAERVATGEYTEPRGDLVLTAPVVFGRTHVLPIIGEFLKAYPKVSVRLVLGDRLLNLTEDHVDLALRIGTLPDSGLVSTGLGRIRRVVCASPAYLAEHGVPKGPQELGSQQCISFEHLTGAYTWRFRAEGAEVAVPVRPRLIVNTAEAAIDAAIAGAGITCVFSYQVESALRAGTLRVMLRRFEPDPIPVSFLYPGRGRLPLKLRALLDFAAPRLRERLQQADAALSERSEPSLTKRQVRVRRSARSRA
jgi:DNA-binding transcriptional LysR family regulator